MEKEKYRLVKELQRRGILTGSRRFGVAKKDSDYDYLISPKAWSKYFEHEIGLIEYDGEDYDEPDFRSFKLKVGGRVYNLLVLHTEKEFIVWKKATDYLLKMDTWLVKTKSIRCSIFDYAKQAARDGKI